MVRAPRRHAAVLNAGDKRHRASATIDHDAKTLFVSSIWRPSTDNGLQSTRRRLLKRADFTEDLHLYDLRGTAITRLKLAGADDHAIALITGHSVKSVSAILESSYLARGARMAEDAIHKLETRTRLVKGV